MYEHILGDNGKKDYNIKRLKLRELKNINFIAPKIRIEIGRNL